MIEKGVLHLDQNEFVGENERMRRKDRKKRNKRGGKRKEKGRKGDPASTGLQHSSKKTLDGSGSELVCAPKCRGSLLLWLFFV